MVEKHLKHMSPIQLRIALCVSIVVLLALAAAGFILFKGWLGDYAQSVSNDSKQADISASDIAALQKLQTELQEDSVAVNRTKNIVADSKSYQYQNQIITDLNTYAEKSGVSLSGYTFDAGGPASSPGTSGTSAPATATTPNATGLKTTSVSITIKNPVKYEAIMQFIHSIEANLTKMQLSGVSLTKAQSDDSVVVGPLAVEVYIR